MLTQLRIAGLGVIDEAVFEPGAGLSVVTGETGAGKTMVISGLGLLLGGRADSAMVRSGEPRALVEGRFTQVQQVEPALAAVGADLDDGELLCSRQVTSSGRSRAYICGIQTTLAQLGEITGTLATIHGQSGQLRLAHPDRQREILDRAAGEEMSDALVGYRAAYQQWERAKREHRELVAHARDRAQEADLLSFGIKEIERLAPEPGEDAALSAEARRLQATDDLLTLAGRAGQLVNGPQEPDFEHLGALDQIGVARKAVEEIAETDQGAARLAELARDAQSVVADLGAEISSYLDSLEADPMRLEAVMARRAELAGLLHKYGATIDEVLAWAERGRQRLDEVGGTDERIAELAALIAGLEDQLVDRAAALTCLRSRAAERLMSTVRKELVALAMPHARLLVELTRLDRPGPWGAESVQLMFSANPGQEPAPLTKVASGGELSRVRLALEVSLAADDPGQVFIFDEVDAGVGGAVALEVGKRLARLAEHSQVIAVTHLAQVAAFADSHWVVAKASDGQVTSSTVRLLNDWQRQAELARMMGGSASSDSGLAHARELLALAHPGSSFD